MKRNETSNIPPELGWIQCTLYGSMLWDPAKLDTEFSRIFGEDPVANNGFPGFSSVQGAIRDNTVNTLTAMPGRLDIRQNGANALRPPGIIGEYRPEMLSEFIQRILAWMNSSLFDEDNLLIQRLGLAGMVNFPADSFDHAVSIARGKLKPLELPTTDRMHDFIFRTNHRTDIVIDGTPIVINKLVTCTVNEWRTDPPTSLYICSTMSSFDINTSSENEIGLCREKMPMARGIFEQFNIFASNAVQEELLTK